MQVDSTAILSKLKDFQRTTVEYVFRKFYIENSTKRFLIADEVGLGKTLIARGIIARTIEHLQQKAVRRIDILYICSNSMIAQQNINRLNVFGEKDFEINSRLTLLPIYGDLDKRQINFISLTPNTSLNLSSSEGTSDERVLLYHMLDLIWGIEDVDTALELLRVNKGRQVFEADVRSFQRKKIGENLLENYRQALHQSNLKDEFLRLMGLYKAQEKRSALSSDRNRFIGALRRVLAYTCIQYLEPDLIILDEFQRFREILKSSGDDEVAMLAQELFKYQDDKTGEAARVILLSATPYKMYTSDYEKSMATDNHHQDFLDTFAFLQTDKNAQVSLKQSLLAYAHAFARFVESAGLEFQPLIERKQQVESLLKEVMVRTERLAVSTEDTERNGMLKSMPAPVEDIFVSDLDSYLALQTLAQEMNFPDMIEYWKSAPYLLNFMREYKFKENFKKLVDSPDKMRLFALSKAFQKSEKLLLSHQQISHYLELDPANAKLRYLTRHYLDEQGAWQLLWIPPSLPYYSLGGVFAGREKLTKRLIFSSWRLVPKVIASLTSYEVERRIVLSDTHAPKRYTRDNNYNYGSLIEFRLDTGGQHARPAAMSAMSLMYPSLVLAEACDPLRLPALINKETAIAEVRSVIQNLLKEAKLRERYEDPSFSDDANWYWAAPILLDKILAPELSKQWFHSSNLPNFWRFDNSLEIEKGGWQKHVETAYLRFIQNEKLGQMPEDLADVLARLALASPAITGLRAISRLTNRPYSLHTMQAAGHIAWSVRTLFNTVEATALIRGLYPELPYWQSLLHYAIDGNLQAVLDEYAHILRDSLGLFDCSDEKLAHDIAIKMGHALSIRAVSLRVDNIQAGAMVKIAEDEQYSIRSHFAMSLVEEGQEKLNQNGQNHIANLRDAFNSPFWPFVLASTSIGQEGLDFHQHCHAIIHWNLPSNPVDLEQREGRIHRFKGHALRRNLARQYGEDVDRRQVQDIWEAMFQIASENKTEQSELVPYWVLPPNGTDDDYSYIERYVPLLPLSRDEQKLARLRSMVAHYRMVFGQVRQEDMLDILMRRGDIWQQISPADLQINLSPIG